MLSGMALVRKLLLLAVAIPSALAVTPFTCKCLLADYNDRQFHSGSYASKQGPITMDFLSNQCGQYPKFPSFNFEYGYIPKGYEYNTYDKLYKVYRTGLSYDKAAAVCRRDGGNLAIPTSSFEAESIASIIKKHTIVNQAFIGINDIEKEGSYVSIDGKPLSQLGYARWKTGESNVSGDEKDCITINANAAYSDHFCNETDFFVCQRAVKPVPPKGYTYLPQMGFYRYYKATQEKFEGAREKCWNDGGSLAIIETQEEAQALVNLYYSQWNGPSFVGLYRMNKEEEYGTRNGKKLSQLFGIWANSEPRDQYCIGLLRNGNYDGINCHIRHSYLCKITLPRN